MVASMAATSLAKVSGNFPIYSSVSRLPVESPMPTVFCLPVETTIWLPVETVFTVSVCLAGDVFPFNCGVVALVVTTPIWAFLASIN